MLRCLLRGLSHRLVSTKSVYWEPMECASGVYKSRTQPPLPEMPRKSTDHTKQLFGVKNQQNISSGLKLSHGDEPVAHILGKMGVGRRDESYKVKGKKSKGA